MQHRELRSMLSASLDGRGVWGRMDTSACMAESLQSPGIITILLLSYATILNHFSLVRLCATPWTVACQAPLSMGFSRQEYWSGLPYLLQGIFSAQVLNPGLPHFRKILYCLSHREAQFYPLDQSYKVVSFSFKGLHWKGSISQS